jgi:hypothetical protein
MYAKSICRYHALCKEHLPLPCSLQRAFAVTMLFAKSMITANALSHNGNALPCTKPHLSLQYITGRSYIYIERDQDGSVIAIYRQ